MENKVIEKVKKLLALANNAAASDGERENALRMAHGFLAKHNLDMLDVANYEQLEGREKLDIETFQMVWCKQICNSIAKLFFCKYYAGEKLNATKGKHYFVGKTSNVITATIMSTYIINSVLKECRKNWAHNLAPQSRSFSIGVADKLNIRIREMMEESKNTDVDAKNALILHNVYKTEEDANDAFIKSQGTALVDTKAKKLKVLTAHYNAGQEFGNNISLNSQIHKL
jgi:hypothetical protein